MKKLYFPILIFLLVFIQSCKKDTVETANDITAPTGEQSYGRCIDNKDGIMTIKINSYYFDKVAPVFLAKTILHETIHAYIYQEVEPLGGYSNIENSTFKNLFAYYVTYGAPGFQHDHMSQYFIPKLANTLKEFDNSNYALDYYEAISWSGLYETYGWSIKTQAEKDAINSKINTINSGDKNCY